MNKNSSYPPILKIMNSILIDCSILVPFFILGLLIFGSLNENGDSNAGSMYGLFILPIIPVILLALTIIQITRVYFKTVPISATCLTPVVLLLIGIGLSSIEFYILLSVIGTIIVFSFVKLSILKR